MTLRAEVKTASLAHDPHGNYKGDFGHDFPTPVGSLGCRWNAFDAGLEHNAGKPLFGTRQYFKKATNHW